ncbi:hypothetical protein Tco_1182185 [Tanacetum coccineum]
MAKFLTKKEKLRYGYEDGVLDTKADHTIFGGLFSKGTAQKRALPERSYARFSSIMMMQGISGMAVKASLIQQDSESVESSAGSQTMMTSSEVLRALFLLLRRRSLSFQFGTACSGSKPTYSDQQRIVPSVSQTSGRSDNVMECVLHSFVAENEQDQDMIYEDFDQVDQLEMEEMDLKWQMAMLSLRINRFEKKAGRKMNYNNQQPARFDRRKRLDATNVFIGTLLWNHAAENKTGEVEKVYGMMAGLHADNGGADASDAAAEFAMMGISPKAGVNACLFLLPITGTYMPSPYQSDIEETQLKDLIAAAIETDQQSILHDRPHLLVSKKTSNYFFPAGRPVFCWDDGELLFKTSSVTLGGIHDQTILGSKSNGGSRQSHMFHTLMIHKAGTSHELAWISQKFPREHDLYTFHISRLATRTKRLLLRSKRQSLDETTRCTEMAHVNFKTINKLAKEGLVDGLPLKVFTNEHNCVACNKGKQHKASYKHISAVRLITDTLQLLHMAFFFGPTNNQDVFDQKYLLTP